MGDVIKTLSVGDVVDDDDAVGVAVVAVGDSSEPLLSGRVPLSRQPSTKTSLAFSPLTLTTLVF